MESEKKQIKRFWAIAAIAVLAFLAGGAVVYIIFQNKLQDDYNSVDFRSHYQDRSWRQKYGSPIPNEN